MLELLEDRIVRLIKQGFTIKMKPDEGQENVATVEITRTVSGHRHMGTIDLTDMNTLENVLQTFEESL